MSEEKFWMVWNLEGRSPKARHFTEELATGEAKRLSKENPGQEFYVVGAVAKCVMPDPVKIVRLKDPTLPF